MDENLVKNRDIFGYTRKNAIFAQEQELLHIVPFEQGSNNTGKWMKGNNYPTQSLNGKHPK